MPPSEKAIIAGIKAAVLAMHTDAPETLTVRNARKKAEEDLGLEAGFLSNEKWKQKSKVAIQDYAVRPPLCDLAETNLFTGYTARQGRVGNRSICDQAKSREEEACAEES